MTTSFDILDAVQAAVVAANTNAGTRVFRPGDWPSQSETKPQIKLRLFDENRVSISRSGAPEFTTTATIRVLAEVEAPASEADAGASAAEAAVWALKRQIEVAVVNSYPLTAMIQQIASMRSQLAFNAEGAMHLGAVQIDLAIEFYEGPESFAPVGSDNIDLMPFTVSTYPPAASELVGDVDPIT